MSESNEPRVTITDSSLMSAWMWAQGWRPIPGVGWRRIHQHFEVIIPHARLHGVYDRQHPERLVHFVRGFELEAASQLSVRAFDWSPAVDSASAPGLVRGEEPAVPPPALEPAPNEQPAARFPWMEASTEQTTYEAPPCWWCAHECTLWRAAEKCRTFELTCLRKDCGFAVSLPDSVDPRSPEQVVRFLLATYGVPVPRR